MGGGPPPGGVVSEEVWTWITASEVTEVDGGGSTVVVALVPERKFVNKNSKILQSGKKTRESKSGQISA